MGGPNAPDKLDHGHRTQVWLAAGADKAAMVTASYFFHRQQRTPSPATQDTQIQDALIDACQRLSGIDLPGQRN
jgi:hypothetical protein